MAYKESAQMLYVIFLLFILVIWLGVVVKDKKSLLKNPRFRLNFLLQLTLYFLEIAAIFYVFQIVSIYFVDSLGYTEPSILKRFLDFFTAYQVFIFVVLKLYDSLKKDSYTSVLYSIELAQPFIEFNKPIYKDIWKGKHLYKEMDSLSKDTYTFYKEFYDLLSKYEQFRIQTKYDSYKIKELNKSLKENKLSLEDFNDLLENAEEQLEQSTSYLDDAKLGIDVLKANINISKEETDFHWNVSLFFRLFKHWFK